MKNLAILLSVVLFISCTAPKTVFELGSNQSMLITGKGIGQDAAFNPYPDETCAAVIKNIGKAPLTIRTVGEGEDTRLLAVQPSETEEVVLLPQTMLFLDSKAPTKARVKFQRLEKG